MNIEVSEYMRKELNVFRPKQPRYFQKTNKNNAQIEQLSTEISEFANSLNRQSSTYPTFYCDFFHEESDQQHIDVVSIEDVAATTAIFIDKHNVLRGVIEKYKDLIKKQKEDSFSLDEELLELNTTRHKTWPTP